MTSSILKSSAWCRALSVAERRSALNKRTVAGFSALESNETGQRRLNRWRAQRPFNSDEYFRRFLAENGMSESQFLEALSASADELAECHEVEPSWLQRIKVSYEEPRSVPFDPPEGEEAIGFLNLIDPMIEQAMLVIWEEIRRLQETYSPTPIDEEIIEDVLLMNLPEPVLQRLGRTMVLELNVLRLQDALEGEDARTRFLSFIRKLRDPVFLSSLFDEYPVLIRQLALVVTQWMNVNIEVLQRLCQDWSLLKTTFSPGEEPGLLVSLAGGAGDTHRRGRSVMIATFDSGLRIVYKPKSMAIDLHFWELVDFLNAAGCKPPLRTFLTLDRYEYGWAEFVGRAECETQDEMHRFYARQGLYLALLHVVASTDFHYENVIAAGEYPMLIDLETMLQPQFDRYIETDADSLAQKHMAESVLSIGLLPMRIWGGADAEGVDISGLGGAAGQLSPDRIPSLADAGTDAMHYERQRVEISGDANRPMLDGEEGNAIEYIDDIETGFRMMYRLVMDNREELLKPGGLIEAFSDDSIRVLMRPTRTYGQLLYESFHPDMLRDAMDRELFLNRLWLVVPGRNHMQAVIGSEQEDLLNGDIPVFTSYPNSLILYDAMENPIEGVLTVRGDQIVRQRIENMSEDDLQRQLWYIRASIASVAEEEHTAPRPSYLPNFTDSQTSRTRLLNAARQAADYLCDIAVEGQNDVTWIGMAPDGTEHWAIATLGVDLYGGSPGIALFFAYAGEILGEQRYTEIARKAYTWIQLQADLISDMYVANGGYEGWGGLLYAYMHMGALWHDDEILSQAERLANRIWGYVEQDDAYGVVRGSAGAIQSLMGFQQVRPLDTHLRIADTCAQHLLETSLQLTDGAGWRIERFAETPLAGYAHGASGIAASLMLLYQATGNDDYKSAAAKAIAYERSLLDPQSGNWPDLRTNGDYDRPLTYGDGNHVAAWCHGASGIGLARLRVIDLLNDNQLEREAETAIRTTLQHGFGATHCLCHGDLGNLELLLQASAYPEWSHLSRHTDNLTARILDSIDSHGWQCGGSPGVMAPGLMLGVAGIGMQLLRIAEPEFAPAVLLLAPPA